MRGAMRDDAVALSPFSVVRRFDDGRALSESVLIGLPFRLDDALKAFCGMVGLRRHTC
jgi:hypothetical protein